MTVPQTLLDELRQLGETAAAQLVSHYGSELRPRLSALLVDAATVEMRRAAGEDVTTARIAIEASLANLALEQRERVQAKAKDIAFKAAIAIIFRLFPPV